MIEAEVSPHVDAVSSEGQAETMTAMILRLLNESFQGCLETRSIMRILFRVP